jgi:signal peptidase II
MRRQLYLFTAAAALIGDQATKAWAATSLHGHPRSVFGGRLLLRESRNPGAAFSIATGQTVLISLLAIVAVVAILVAAHRATSAAHQIGWGLVAGGATGNLADRLFRTPGPLRGHVVDWLDLGWFPSFNAADSAITLGVLLLLTLSLRGATSSPPAGAGSPDEVAGAA